MSTNRDLSEIFDRMAKVLEITGANRFKVIAYQRGARAMKDMTGDAGEMDFDELIEVDGIGKGLAEKIVEYNDSKKIAEHDELMAKVPAGVIAMLDIPGLGPKTVATIWKEGGVETIEDLKRKIATGELDDLPRIGKKTLDNIAKSIEFKEKSGDRFRIGQALPLAEAFVEKIAEFDSVEQVAYAGSLRRGKETIGDIDILVAGPPEGDIGKRFRELDGVTDVLVAGETKSSVRTEIGIQIDLRVVPKDKYGAALMYFTGSKEHNVALRQRAIDRKMSLNEYGLWPKDAGENDSPVASKTEEDIYKALDLPWIAPELREDRGEIRRAEAGELPELIELADIRCDLHAHTTASDGKLYLDELIDLARQRGYHTIAVTDHSVSQGQANGLSAERLVKHIEAIRKADAAQDDIKILAGTEVDILADGKLDYEDDLLAELDIVVASPHSALSQDGKKATKRMRAAIENPHVDIIGHATGRLIGRREGMSPNFDELFKAAAENDTAFEINANPFRLDLRDIHAKAAIDAGVKLSINTDTHGPADMALMRYGILTARRAGVTKKHVINCLTEEQLLKWLKRNN